MNVNNMDMENREEEGTEGQSQKVRRELVLEMQWPTFGLTH